MLALADTSALTCRRVHIPHSQTESLWDRRLLHSAPTLARGVLLELQDCLQPSSIHRVTRCFWGLAPLRDLALTAWVGHSSFCSSCCQTRWPAGEPRIWHPLPRPFLDRGYGPSALRLSHLHSLTLAGEKCGEKRGSDHTVSSCVLTPALPCLSPEDALCP